MPTQSQLFTRLAKGYPSAVVRPGSYILVPGDAPVLLVAHLDTVHKEPVRVICASEDGRILMSPQGIGGDDRCGVYALVTVRERSAVKPWLLFTCDEEVGGIGAEAFCADYASGALPEGLASLKAIVEIDRAGKDDAVYYDCANEDFEAYITGKGFKTQLGSFSDISYIAPALDVAAVNLSAGYYCEHTQHEYIDLSHLERTIERVCEIVADAANPKFPRYPYIEGFSSLGAWPDESLAGSYMQALTDIPANIRLEYGLLLDYGSFSHAELERVRREDGEWAIRDLAALEFGPDYRARCI